MTVMSNTPLGDHQGSESGKVQAILLFNSLNQRRLSALASSSSCNKYFCTNGEEQKISKRVIFIHKESKPTCRTMLLFICSYISNMFLPDLLAIFQESHAAKFNLELSHVITAVVVFIIIKIIKIWLWSKYSWDIVKIQLRTV